MQRRVCAKGEILGWGSSLKSHRSTSCCGIPSVSCRPPSRHIDSHTLSLLSILRIRPLQPGSMALPPTIASGADLVAKPGSGLPCPCALVDAGGGVGQQFSDDLYSLTPLRTITSARLKPLGTAPDIMVRNGAGSTKPRARRLRIP